MNSYQSIYIKRYLGYLTHVYCILSYENYAKIAINKKAIKLYVY